MKLSLLILTTPDRDHFMVPLLREIRSQIATNNLHGHVEIIVESDNYEYLIGWKRNNALIKSDGEYMAFIDSDDRIGQNYLKLVFAGIDKDIDCCSLLGEITEDGLNPLIFEHSLRYKEYRTNPDNSARVRYERYPNHLNCIKASIAKQFRFPEKNHGEDTDWATQVFNSGLIKTEHEINEVIYYYDYRRVKSERK